MDTENSKKWENFLNPEILKSNLILTSIFIAFFENTKDYIISQPRDFFCTGFTSENGEIISPDYEEKVLSFDKKHKIIASLKWFKSLEAISDSDITIYDELRNYRNKLAHELLNNLFEGINTEEFTKNLSDLMTLRIKLEKWWIIEIEIPTSDLEDANQINEADIISGTELIYQIFMDMLSGDEKKANYYWEELKKFNSPNKK